jgi:hypothetical protein
MKFITNLLLHLAIPGMISALPNGPDIQAEKSSVLPKIPDYNSSDLTTFSPGPVMGSNIGQASCYGYCASTFRYCLNVGS